MKSQNHPNRGKRLSDTTYHYTPNAGEEPGDVTCGVCGTVMDVKRNVEGPRSLAGAMSGLHRKYDEFTCSNAGERWHQQVVLLNMEASRTSSGWIEESLRREATHVLLTRQTTKDLD